MIIYNFSIATDDDDDDDDEEDEDEDDDQQQGNTQNRATNGDVVVEDLDELNRLYVGDHGVTRSNENQMFSKPMKRRKRKKGTTKKTFHGHQKPKLKHWEKMALEQTKQDTCNCRHHVMRLEADQVVYDWCRCKDHQHKDLMERRKSIALPPPPTASRRTKTSYSTSTASTSSTKTKTT